jgi:helix-turn-helix protein
MGADKKKGTVRTKCLILYPGEGIPGKTMECRIKLTHDGLTLDYGKGSDFFRFSAISDLGFRPPHLEDLNGLEEVFAIRMNNGRILILGRGENPLLYSKDEFEEAVHSIFAALLNGVTVHFLDSRRKGSIRVLLSKVGLRGNAFVVDEEFKPVLSFSALSSAELEVQKEPSGERRVVWKVKTVEHGAKPASSFKLWIPIKKARLFLLRYLLRYGAEGHVFSLAGEFSELSKEVRKVAPHKLTGEERDVLMALLSGVDPLEVPAVLRMEPAEVEEVYDSLIEKGFLRLIGVRKVVAPTELAGSIDIENFDKEESGNNMEEYTKKTGGE